MTAQRVDIEWLPRHCPDWCDAAHALARAEGCSWEDSQRHLYSGPGEVLCELKYADRPVRPWGGGWELSLTQRPLCEDGGNWGPPLVNLTTRDTAGGSSRVDLTGGEARSLAAQLIALADKADLG